MVVCRSSAMGSRQRNQYEYEGVVDKLKGQGNRLPPCPRLTAITLAGKVYTQIITVACCAE